MEWLQWPKRAVRALFQSDVTLRRGKAGVRLALQERAADPVARPASAAELAERRRKRELQLMLAQLAGVLDEMPETRETLRHLVFVEHALAKKGLKALRKMPIDVLKRALDQFESLVSNWSPEGLANLRSKMAVAVIERETHPDAVDPDGPESLFDPARIEAVLDQPRIQAEQAIQAAREAAFADSTIEKLALQFAGPRPAKPAVELQGELDSPSGKALARMKAVSEGQGSRNPGEPEDTGQAGGRGGA